MENVNDRDLLIAKEAALKLRIDTQRLYHLTRTGEIPAILLGQRSYRWSKKAIEAWLERGGSRSNTEVQADV